MTIRAPFAIAAVVALAACTKMAAPGFPPPARPGVLVSTDFITTFRSVETLLENRGMPVLRADSTFGYIHTDWVYWDPEEVDLEGLADCDLPEQAPPARTRARFGFDVRKRANRASVTILTQWQAERYLTMDQSDRGYVDCRSTGEWERRVEESLTQRQIR